MINKIFSLLTVILFLSAGASAQTTVSTSTTKVEASDGQKLSAIWTIPSQKVVAAALIIQGSGNVGADGDVSGPFLGTGYKGQSAKLSEQISNALASVGVATLRYAKRGVDDPAQLPNQKFPYLVNDAESAYKAVQTKFPTVKNIIIGFSEGGLVASLLTTTVKK